MPLSRSCWLWRQLCTAHTRMTHPPGKWSTTSGGCRSLTRGWCTSPSNKVRTAGRGGSVVPRHPLPPPLRLCPDALGWVMSTLAAMGTRVHEELLCGGFTKIFLRALDFPEPLWGAQTGALTKSGSLPQLGQRECSGDSLLWRPAPSPEAHGSPVHAITRLTSPSRLS